MKSRAKQDAGRRMEGRFSSRLSNKSGSGRHRAFRTAPEFFRLAVESLSEYALITTDRDRRISSWSGPAARMFGYSESEIIGQSISRLFTPEDVAKGIDKREFEEALEKGRMDDERWHVRKDGTRLWCYGLSFPLRDEKGAFRGFIKLIRDDSDRKTKDDLLREKEERLRLAAESTGLGTWDYSVAKGALQLSPRAAELFGLGAEPEGCRLEQFIERIEPEDRDRVRRALERCLAVRGDREAELEYRVRMPDGALRWVRTLARAFYERGAGEGAAPNRLLGTVVDVTESRKRLAQERELNQELERRVRLRTTELTALNKELESFAYSASHDLRAPIRKISAYTQAILEGGKSPLHGDDRRYFERIRAAAGTMHRLIDETLALAQVTRKPLESADCDLSALARDVAAELREQDPARQVEFVIADGLRVQADRELLSRALRSLLENAWKFTSRHPTARIEFGLRGGVGHPVYFVEDDGAGFDMRYAQNLFGAFRRLHGESEYPGTGVGLAMTERIIRRLRGRIWAEAEVERARRSSSRWEPRANESDAALRGRRQRRHRARAARLPPSAAGRRDDGRARWSRGSRGSLPGLRGGPAAAGGDPHRSQDAADGRSGAAAAREGGLSPAAHPRRGPQLLGLRRGHQGTAPAGGSPVSDEAGRSGRLRGHRQRAARGHEARASAVRPGVKAWIRRRAQREWMWRQLERIIRAEKERDAANAQLGDGLR